MIIRLLEGKGGLPLDQIQRYYGQAIVQNVGDFSGMQNAQRKVREVSRGGDHQFSMSNQKG